MSDVTGTSKEKFIQTLDAYANTLRSSEAVNRLTNRTWEDLREATQQATNLRSELIAMFPEQPSHEPCALRGALLHIRERTRSDAADFETATIDLREIYQTANVALESVGALFARPTQPPPALCAICDHIEELHTHPGVQASHAFVPRPSPPPPRALGVAPIAKVSIIGGVIDDADLYAPGLPDGWHDLFPVPLSPNGELQPSVFAPPPPVAPDVDRIAEAAWRVLNHDNDPHDGHPANASNWKALRDAVRSALTKSSAPAEQICGCDAPYREGYECMNGFLQPHIKCRRLGESCG